MALRLVVPLFLLVCVCAAGVTAACAMAPAPEQSQRSEAVPAYFSIATGSTANTYFPIGSMIATIVSHPAGSVRCEIASACGPEGLIAVALASRGSVQNVRDIALGRVESGFVQADIAAYALKGEGPFKGEKAYTELRAIGRLYPEAVHLAVARGSGITSLAGLKRKRVAIDVPDSGTHLAAREILAAARLGAKSLTLIEVNSDHAANMLAKGEVDAIFVVGGLGTETIHGLAEAGAIDLLPIEDAAAQRLTGKAAFFRPMTIEAGVYPGIGDTQTIAVGALWVVAAKTDDDLVYSLTSALWDPSNRPFFERGHPQARRMSRDAALEGVSIPLHPGAERYYAERGIVPPEGSALPKASARPVVTPVRAPR